jgi:hypothetical protein
MRSPQQRDRLDAVRIGLETGPTSTWLSTELKTSSRAGGLPSAGFVRDFNYGWRALKFYYVQSLQHHDQPGRHSRAFQSDAGQRRKSTLLLSCTFQPASINIESILSRAFCSGF